MTRKTTIEDVIDAIEEALNAATALNNEESEGDSKKAAIKAITEIRAGRLADAITTLEHEFLPKWADRDACRAAYDKAMEIAT